ncbi:hypothetical protein AVEN_82596-1, partial [Araneus ventricosus]
KLGNGESASIDAEDVLNEGNTISSSAVLQSVETLLDYMGQRGFDYGDITAVCKICVDIRQEMNKQQKQRRISDFFKAVNVKRKIPSSMLYRMQLPGVFGRKRHELDSPNLGGHLPRSLTPCYNLPLRRREMGVVCKDNWIPYPLISEAISEPPLKRKQPPQTGLCRC